MPHKRKPRSSKRVMALVTTDNVVRMPKPVGRDPKNWLASMDYEERLEANKIIEQRYESAQPTTDRVAVLIDQWDKQYRGVWRDADHDEEDHIFLTKTREQVQVVRAFLIMLLSQLPHLVGFKPRASTVSELQGAWDRAKIAEVTTNFYMQDVWRLKDDLFPRWITQLLVTPMAITKVTYREDPFQPDLLCELVDRALLYIDPTAHELRKAGWVIEKDFPTVAEVEEEFERGVYERPEDFGDTSQWASPLSGNDKTILERLFGAGLDQAVSVPEDERVERWHYWQPPVKGRASVYAVKLGGEGGPLVRYGPIPFAYEGHPYRGKSYDAHPWQVDGTPLAEMYRATQEVFNTLLNLRLDDVRRTMQAPYLTFDEFISKTTLDDAENRRIFWRLSKDAYDARKNDPNFELSKSFHKLDIRPATDGIFQDIALILGQGKEAVQTGDIFRGQMPQKQATFGEVREVLERNMGVFRPVWFAVMRQCEEIAEISLEYFKDPDFFGPSRLVTIAGTSRYATSLQGWTPVGQGELMAREVTPDQMDVDVSIDAVSGADMLLSRSFLATSMQQIFHGFGQVPGLWEEVRDEYDWAGAVELILNSAGADVGVKRLTEQEAQKRKEARAQSAQGALQQQAQMEALMARAKEGAKAEGQAAVEAARAQHQAKLEQVKTAAQHEATLEEIVAKVSAQHRADIEQSNLDHRQQMERMFAEFRMEIAAQRAGGNVSVGSGSNRVNASG